MKIIADRREKNSLVISELIGKGIDVEMKHLEVADYIISEEIAVERKTISDFVYSMINKRLAKQLIDLKGNYSKPILIIEGYYEQDMYKSERYNVHENAIRGMILSILIEFAVPIIFTKDSEDTAKFLSVLAKRQEQPHKEISLKAKRKASSVSEQQQFIVEGFPGIGPTLAKNMLKKFKTIRGIMNADIKDLEKVEKINSKKAEIVYKLLRENYRG